MRKFQSATVVFGLVFISGLSACYGDITYNMVNDPVNQNGYNLSGTIVSDGTIGALTAIDIVSWQFTITGHGATFQATSPPSPAEEYTASPASRPPTPLSKCLEPSTSSTSAPATGCTGIPRGRSYYGEATRQDIWVTSGQGSGLPRGRSPQPRQSPSPHPSFWRGLGRSSDSPTDGAAATEHSGGRRSTYAVRAGWPLGITPHRSQLSEELL